MQLKKLLQHATNELKTITTTPRLEAEVLLGKVLNLTRAQLITRDNQEVPIHHQQEFSALLSRRLQGEPIAYILGQQEFWSLMLNVTPDTLIPRPETELLVELVLTQLFQPVSSPLEGEDAQRADEGQATPKIQIADLGTGSGAIALALASERPTWHITATDQSPAALKIAQQNAHRLDLKNLEFRQGNWCQALPKNQKFTAIISNPPYIHPQDEHLTQGDVRFEPQTALVAADDGLADLKTVITQAKDHLISNGWIFLEHGYDQGPAVVKLLTQAGYIQVSDHLDQSGLSRVAMGQWPA